MSKFNPNSYEKKWQALWQKNQTYKTAINPDKEKFYVLDMFPYPSGAGLHVGHPLGYIATDILARYKRQKGFQVLHPMGYDAFGLPAEQYAIQTGKHPAQTTEENIKRYKEQLDNIGFSFDWDRELKTCEPNYYKWTQWIFIQLYNSWYNPKLQKAEPIENLIHQFNSFGFNSVEEPLTGGLEQKLGSFTALDWQGFDAAQQENILQHFRLAFLSEAFVNWCPALGTVLANEEVKDGFSERGGFPVERKLMKQWSLRITAYADRLLDGLEQVDWNESLKETQRNWIGKSTGAEVEFKVKGSSIKIPVFTTRPDTLFGVSFMVLAPENELVDAITTPERRALVNDYVNKAKNRSEVERMADAKNASGEFTGAYAIHPFTGAELPIWTGDYVLVGYGTGAVMGVPAHDSRDHVFAKQFNLPIEQVVMGKQEHDVQEASLDAKEGTLINSDFLDGLSVKEGILKAIEVLVHKGLGKAKTNYRLRDAVFGRQRYWGEPIPIYYDNGLPKTILEKHLPLELPAIDKFLPTAEGEPPLARAEKWHYHPDKGLCNKNEGFPIELTTMPGWAGSSWYFLRYTDPNNTQDFASHEALEYWNQVDFYIGGAEHATGHLLYARFWTKLLVDLGYLSFDEPFKKLINQGMILGRSLLLWEDKLRKIAVSADRLKEDKTLQADELNLVQQHVDVNLADGNDCIAVTDLQTWRTDYQDYVFYESQDNPGLLKLDALVEKMSKSKWNVVNPDLICEKYGADTLRLYEMFLGPLTDSKPWNTNGIEGVYRFLAKLWRLFITEEGKVLLEAQTASEAELKILHKTIKKVTDDIERQSFNTAVSSFMIAVNELSSHKCKNKDILQSLLILLSPFAPHICEELWHIAGNNNSIVEEAYPVADESYLIENSFSYPVSINGKTRTQISLALDLEENAVKEAVIADETIQKWLEGKALKKFVFVKGRIINLVV